MSYDPETFKKEERDVYDRIARQWNEHMADMTAPYSWRLLDVLSPEYHSRLLDVACGTGQLAQQAVVQYACSVEAVDLSEGMLREAKRRSDGVKGINYRQGDAEQLEFADGSFDYAASAFGLMYFPDPRRAISEIRRVLRPGGRAGFAVWADAYQTPALRILVAAMAEVMAPAPLRLLLGMGIVGERILVSATEEEIPGKGPSPFRFGKEGKLEDLLMEMGFADVDATGHNQVCRFASFEAFWARFVQSTPRHVEPDERQMAEIDRRLRKKAVEYKAGDGYAFPMKALLVTGTKKS
jgi:ubiquinone/menaquinone biosynthesis C-methylase UbiE